MSFLGSSGDPTLPRGLEYDEDGLVKGWDTVHELVNKGALSKADKRRLKDVRDRHPIEELIEAGKKRWADLLERSAAFLIPFLRRI